MTEYIYFTRFKVNDVPVGDVVKVRSSHVYRKDARRATFAELKRIYGNSAKININYFLEAEYHLKLNYLGEDHGMEFYKEETIDIDYVEIKLIPCQQSGE